MFVKIITDPRWPKGDHVSAQFKLVECVSAEVRPCPFNESNETHLSVACSLSVDNSEIINYRIQSSAYFISDKGETIAQYHT